MNEEKRYCEWCDHHLDDGYQVVPKDEPDLCGACHTRFLVNLPPEASNELVAERGGYDQ